jgi:LacI family transcriptional regulator
MGRTTRIDIVDVAREAGTSISTVSRVFNHPGLVKHATRKRVEEAVRQLGYIRNRAAQTMHGRRSATIGLVVPTIDHAIFAEVIQAFTDAVSREGFTILAASHGYDLDQEYAILRKFLEHRVDGLAVIGLEHNAETFALFESQNVPAMSIWNYSETTPLSCVGADNRAAGALAAQHIVDLGHRNVGIVFPPIAGNDRAQDRRAGVLDTLKAAGIAPMCNVETPYSISDAKEAITGVLRQDHRLTALICGNDVIATGALYAARRAALPVPEKLSIIGIGDFKGSRDMEPALTTVRLPAQEIGTLAGQHMVQAIVTDDTTVHRIRCTAALQERDTTARPYSAA